MVQTLAANGPDQAFHVGILPRAVRTRHNVGDAQTGNPPTHLVVVDAVPVSQQVPWRGVLGEGLNQLLGGPVEVGRSVQLTCTMRRRWCEIKTTTKSTRPVSVETVKKSIETRAERWFARNVRHGWEGRDSCASSRETVRSEISIPSFRSSPWRRGAPHSGLAAASR